MPKRNAKKIHAPRRWRGASLNYLHFKHLPAALICLGLLFLGTSQFRQAQWHRATAIYIPIDYSISARYSQRPIAITSSVLSVPITAGEYSAGKWTISDSSANVLTTSAYPGEAGNIIIYGHNTTNIFGNLRLLAPGDTVTLHLANGTDRSYTVTTKQQVKPTQIEFLQPTDTETLTLYTCAGFLDRERLVLQAVPL